MTVKVETDAERFWRHVDRDGPIPAARPDLGHCWLWLGSDIRGYGQFSVGSRPKGTRGTVKAHRFAFELEELIPAGLTLDHLCRVRTCVRKSHLEPVTIGVNTLRGKTVGARNAAKTLCHRGHPFDSATANGRHRVCRTCAAAAQRRFRAAHPAPVLEGEALERQRARNREYTRAFRARRREHLVSA